MAIGANRDYPFSMSRASQRPAAVGVDVGSTAAKVVVVGANGETLVHAVRRHRGRGAETARALLDELPLGRGLPRGVTGSLGTALAGELGATPLHEVEAAARVARARHPDTRTLVELGGQDAKLVFLAEDEALDDMQMNDRCAAGTGATLDRIFRRLEVTESWLRQLTLRGEARVASKCGVFAETDVVNLLERGVPLEHAVSALMRALVLQNLAVLARGRLPRPPVLLLGGPHAHLPVLTEAWREALEHAWHERGWSGGEVRVPDDAELYPALGAALGALRSGPRRGGPARRLRMSELSPRTALGALVDGPDSARTLGELEGSLAAASRRLPGSSTGARVALGIDAGSTTVKAALVSETGELVAKSYGPATGEPLRDVQRRVAALADALAGCTVSACGVTGYGAAFLEALLGADAAPVETVAHLESALSVDPHADVIVDVGGTDVKVLEVAAGAVRDFTLSNQCSAGLGSFLADSARDLGISLDEFAPRALSAGRAAPFGVGCAVFMDTDRVTLRREGYTAEEVLAGLAWSIPRNVWQFVTTTPLAQLGERVVLSGGTHRNLAVALAHARYLQARGKRVTLHPHPELAGAIGAASLAARATLARGRSRFIGIDALGRVRVEVRTDASTRCGGCELDCERSFLELETADEPLVVGHRCDRGSSASERRPRSKAHAPNLVALESRLLFRPLLPLPWTPARRERVRVGFPRVMAHYRSAPLLLHYLRGLGVADEDVLLSPETTPELLDASQLFGANDPCFPAKLVLAHVDWLLARDVDVVLFPSITHAQVVVEGTIDTASCPVVAAAPHTARAALADRPGDRERLLTPTLSLLDAAGLERQLFEGVARPLGASPEESRRALDYGRAAQRAFTAKLQRAGTRLLARARRDGHSVAVMLMRPYHADPGVNHGVPAALAARGIPVMGLCALPSEHTTLSGEEARCTNSGCAEKLWAARLVTAHPELLAVELGSFRCGQDASILGALADHLARAHKPSLRLYDLDEDRPQTTLDVRLDTFADAVRGHRRRVRSGDARGPMEEQP